MMWQEKTVIRMGTAKKFVMIVDCCHGGFDWLVPEKRDEDSWIFSVVGRIYGIKSILVAYIRFV